jgi:predicted kinase|uniref:AAA family ATPase n=1 Tax=Desulfobacca acetoxidans TaxID=60893 RepID=A0A7V6DNQ4_9BACT
MDRLLVVIFGLMGVGKSTVAKALGEARGWPVIHSDVLRKSLAGLPPTTRAHFEFGQGIYHEDFSRKTYAEMRRRAGELLDGGAPRVILDASFKSAGERRRVRELAREKEARTAFIYCSCPKELVRQRLKHRAGNSSAISDGRLELLDLQMEDFEPLTEEDQPLLRLDTGRDLGKVLQEVNEFLDGLSVQ